MAEIHLEKEKERRQEAGGSRVEGGRADASGRRKDAGGWSEVGVGRRE